MWVLLMLFGVILLFGSLYWNRVAMVQKIQDSGGFVGYHEPADFFPSSIEKYLPNIFLDIKSIDSSHCPITPELEEFILSQNQLRSIGLDHCRLSDNFVKGLSKLKLNEIFLANTNIEDRHVVIISSCTELWSLDLSGTKITDKSLIELEKLKLSLLYLNGTGVSDLGMKSIPNYRNLTDLSLERTRISDRGVVELCASKSLLLINLKGTNITIKSLVALRDIKKYASVDIKGTKITRDDLRHFEFDKDKLIINP